MSDAQPAPRPVRLRALLARPPRGPASGPAAPTLPQRLAEAHEVGRAEALAEVQPHIAALEAELAEARAILPRREQALAAEARAATTALEGAFAAELVSLALAIAGQLLQANPVLPAETLESLIREALAAVPQGEAGTLFVPEPAQAHAAGLLPAGWRLAVDPALAPGEVRAEAGPALAFTGLAHRLAALATALEAGK